MDNPQYTTLPGAAAAVPDPRKARGKRHLWRIIWTVIPAALTSGAQGVKGICDWVAAHQEELQERLRPPRGIPSESTLRRALRQVDVAALEERLSQHVAQAVATAEQAAPRQPGQPARLRGQAVDGKSVRGVRRYGQPLHLVSLVRHGSGVVLGQRRVADKRNEIAAVPELLAGRDLTGTVTTMDALLTQRNLAQQILEQNGHYLMVVKANQPNLYDDIRVLFAGASWTVQEKAQEYQCQRTAGKAHGRIEVRTLETSTTLADYLDWPGAVQVLRRRSRRTVVKTGKTSEKVTYAVTSLAPQEADGATLAQLWREHWTIENKLHYVRDVTMKEDASQLRSGHAPQAMTVLRNTILSRFRLAGWQRIPQAFQHFAASLERTLRFLGVVPDT